MPLLFLSHSARINDDVKVDFKVINYRQECLTEKSNDSNNQCFSLMLLLLLLLFFFQLQANTDEVEQWKCILPSLFIFYTQSRNIQMEDHYAWLYVACAASVIGTPIELFAQRARRAREEKKKNNAYRHAIAFPYPNVQLANVNFDWLSRTTCCMSS